LDGLSPVSSQGLSVQKKNKRYKQASQGFGKRSDFTLVNARGKGDFT
jgi:hypothetical protein